MITAKKLIKWWCYVDCYLVGVSVSGLDEREAIVEQAEPVERRQRAVAHGCHQLRQHSRLVPRAVVPDLNAAITYWSLQILQKIHY